MFMNDHVHARIISSATNCEPSTHRNPFFSQKREKKNLWEIVFGIGKAIKSRRK
jgi:hypothetical protein